MEGHDDEASAHLKQLYLDGWVYGDGITDEAGNRMPHKDPWVSSVYWAVTTMCTIRYGDISAGDPKPQTPSPEPGDGEQRAGIQTEDRAREIVCNKSSHTETPHL